MIKYTTVPFDKLFGRTNKWAKDPAFTGYRALIPLGTSIDDPDVVDARRRNATHVVELAIADLRAKFRRARKRTHRHALSVRIARLKDVLKSDIPLPRKYAMKVTTETEEYLLAGGTRRLLRQTTVGPRTLVIDLETLAKRGLRFALSAAKCKALLGLAGLAEDTEDE